MGIVDPSRNHSKNYDYNMILGDSVYIGYKQKWDAVKELNEELKILGPHLLELEDASEADPFKSDETPTRPVIESVTNSLGSTVPVQFQTFKHTQTNEYYIFAVNRGCRPGMDNQTVGITLKSSLFTPCKKN